MRLISRLTVWGWFVLAVTILASAGWLLIVNDWYRESRGSQPYQSGSKFWSGLVIAFPVLFFLAGHVILKSMGRSVLKPDPAEDSGETSYKNRHDRRSRKR